MRGPDMEGHWIRTFGEHPPGRAKFFSSCPDSAVILI